MRGKHKHSKVIVVMLFPALFFIFAVGWVMHCMGTQKNVSPQQPKKPKEDYVHFMPVILEETTNING